MDTKDKLLEWLRGERDWEQRDMARECLAEIQSLASIVDALDAEAIHYERLIRLAGA